MTFPKISDVTNLDSSSLAEEILVIKRELFDLRLKRATRQDFQPHLFKHSKHRLAQLLTVEKSRTKSTM
uniref:Large ribosomal subunit protein uL29c n=2 Tax=Pyropia yezoensis TaxID=2788 RepID=RK29_PYRYE|nr:ribosomal protein L29 [Neopyropia yezoensis]Q1XDI2.1 RecName: Full=Large ribosomal subunit protein uL29c; AltName: Full=50S ribosomal protein L29, chloroplastic [Neopyropia yezoensis]ABJ91322.1 50S ribosomal protein L29 [Neopyropia yezoensis]AGH27632.1 ribosomal protein L29 [Neopyropia yezoensis]QFZ66968.1 ribosomal protein L29 [Neopyropia yezoensis]ULU28947.1 ribosomal protein L29 [Neopyropia yezoensis]WKD83463.1 ribosomal protein L29 [Neopyropia yezoensis]